MRCYITSRLGVAICEYYSVRDVAHTAHVYMEVDAGHVKGPREHMIKTCSLALPLRLLVPLTRQYQAVVRMAHGHRECLYDVLQDVKLQLRQQRWCRQLDQRDIGQGFRHLHRENRQQQQQSHTPHYVVELPLLVEK